MVEGVGNGGLSVAMKPSSHEVSPKDGIKAEMGEYIMTFSDF